MENVNIGIKNQSTSITYLINVNLTQEAPYLRKDQPVKQGQSVDVFHFEYSFVNLPTFT